MTRKTPRVLTAAAKAARFDAVALTADIIVGGNRERCLRTGFTSPPRLTLRSALSFALHPAWAINYYARERFALPNLASHVAEGSNIALSVSEYFTSMLDQSRGSHVLKALSVGAKACSGGRLYLYALAAAGQAGVERALG